MIINDKKSPFYRPERPENFRELLRWLFKEPLLLKRFDKSMALKERRLYFLNKVFPKLALLVTFITVVSWLIIIVIMSGTNFPYYHPDYFQKGAIVPPYRYCVDQDLLERKIVGINSLDNDWNNKDKFYYSLTYKEEKLVKSIGVEEIISSNPDTIYCNNGKLLIMGIGAYEINCYSILISNDSTLLAEIPYTLHSTKSFLEKFGVIFSETFLGLLSGLLLGLMISFVFGVINGSIGDLAFGMATGIIFGLSFGLYNSLLSVRMSFVLIGGAFGCLQWLTARTTSLYAGSVLSLVIGIFIWLTVGLLSGWTAGGATAFMVAYGIILIWYGLTFFFWQYSFLKSFFEKNSPTNNPYLRSGTILLPIYKVERDIVEMLENHGDLGKLNQFIHFLLEWRPFQRNFAMELGHLVEGAKLRIYVLDVRGLQKPIFSKDIKKYYPAHPEWYQQYEYCREALSLTLNEHNKYEQYLGYKEKVLPSLKRWRSMAATESPLWHRPYLDGLDKWIQETEERITKLGTESRLESPFGSNPYLPKKALRVESGRELFKGRDEVVQQLSHHVGTALQMPMLLLQGQRRIGKTSLLNYLEKMLGSRYKVVKLDLQAPECATMPQWMTGIHYEVCNKLSIEHKWAADDNWIKSWQELSDFLKQSSDSLNEKLIIAFDEYEKLHEFFEERPKEGGQLLAAMRNFTQHQGKVVFLFIGQYIFADLKNPNWSEYLVQAERIRIDYLSEMDARLLMNHPRPDFELEFDDIILDKIIHLTQGHPSLLHEIGSELFNLCSQRKTAQITQELLQEVLDTKILDRSNNTIEIFWSQFCHAPRYKEAVLAIIASGVCEDKPVVLRLKDYGFIVEKEPQRYKMRVPIFEEWVNRNKDYY